MQLLSVLTQRLVVSCLVSVSTRSSACVSGNSDLERHSLELKLLLAGRSLRLAKIQLHARPGLVPEPASVVEDFDSEDN